MVKKMVCPFCEGKGYDYIIDRFTGMDTDAECSYCKGQMKIAIRKYLRIVKGLE